MLTSVHGCPEIFAENAELSSSYGFRSKGTDHSSIASNLRTRAVASQIRQYVAGSNGSLGRGMEEKGEKFRHNAFAILHGYLNRSFTDLAYL